MSDRLTICDRTPCGEAREHWHLANGSTIVFAPCDGGPMPTTAFDVVADVPALTPAERAAALGLLHWCDQCPGTPEERAAIEAHEREARRLPTLHTAPEPMALNENEDDPSAPDAKGEDNV